MKTVKLTILLLSLIAAIACFTSCGKDEPMQVAKAPIFAMDDNFTITATCPNAYKAYVNGVETKLPWTVTQTYQQQTIVVSGYGYGEGMQNSETIEKSFTVPAKDMPVAAAPVFAMDDNFTITATCPNAYKAFVNSVEVTLPYTVSQTSQQQTIVVSGYGYGDGMQNSESTEQTFTVPAYETHGFINEHEYVVIGGKRWATMNIGATSLSGNDVVSAPMISGTTVSGTFYSCYGYYFKWGETVPCTTSCIYENFPPLNSCDNGKLCLEHDAARVNWGGPWRMPTKDDLLSLYQACGGSGTLGQGNTPAITNENKDKKGIYWCKAGQTVVPEFKVAGMLFVQDANHKVFFPAAGRIGSMELYYDGYHGFCWSSTIDPTSNKLAIGLMCRDGMVSPYHGDYRYLGCTIRAIAD